MLGLVHCTVPGTLACWKVALAVCHVTVCLPRSVVVRGVSAHTCSLLPCRLALCSCYSLPVGATLGRLELLGDGREFKQLKMWVFFQYYIKVVLWLPPPQKKIQIIAFDIVGEKIKQSQLWETGVSSYSSWPLPGATSLQWRDIIPSRAGLTVQSVHPDTWWRCHWFCTAVPMPAPKSLHPGLCAPVLVLCMVQLSGPWLC